MDFRGRGGDQVLKPGGAGDRPGAGGGGAQRPGGGRSAWRRTIDRAAEATGPGQVSDRAQDSVRRAADNGRPRRNGLQAAVGAAATPSGISDPAELRARKPRAGTRASAVAVAAVVVAVAAAGVAAVRRRWWWRWRWWPRWWRRWRTPIGHRAQARHRSARPSLRMVLASIASAYNGSDKAYVGVMAQEVQTVMPKAVTRGPRRLPAGLLRQAGRQVPDLRALDCVGRPGACRCPCFTLICLRERGCHEQSSCLVDDSGSPLHSRIRRQCTASLQDTRRGCRCARQRGQGR